MPGWYPDPTGTPQLRFFDGSDWTEQVGPLPAALTALPPAPGAPIPLPPVRASNVGRIIVIVSGLVIIALILLIGLASTLLHAGKNHPGSPELQASVISACQGAVKQQLNDPGGLEFTDWSAHASDGRDLFAPSSSPYSPNAGDTMYHARGYVSQKTGPGGHAGRKIYDCDAVVRKHGDIVVLAYPT